MKIVLTEAGKKWMKEHYPPGIIFEYELDGEFEIRSMGADDIEVVCPMGIPYRIANGLSLYEKARAPEIVKTMRGETL